MTTRIRFKYFVVFYFTISTCFLSAQNPIWGVGALIGQADGEFSSTFYNSNTPNSYITNSWTGVPLVQMSTTLNWQKSLVGHSNGAYYNPGHGIIYSPSQINGVAIFDSDFQDNDGVVGALGTGLVPAPQSGELVSPRIDLSGYTDSIISVKFYCNWRPAQVSQFLVSMSVNDGVTWEDVDISQLFPTTQNTVNDGWVCAVFHNLTQGVSNLMHCRLRFLFEGAYYYAMIDDISLHSGIINCPESLSTSQIACSSPHISTYIPTLRPGFTNQSLHIQACNKHYVSDSIVNAYVLVNLDPLLTVQNCTHAYTNLGQNQYRVDLGTLHPGDCSSIRFGFYLDSNAVIGQSLCVQTELLPMDSCSLDTISTPYPSGIVSPCNLPWDNSSLQVNVSCINDSVRFVIYNTGAPVGGDMDCYSPLRIFVDGQIYMLDSIQLLGGDSIIYMFEANGQTWHLEVDQHPLHPGNSHPNATQELCGDTVNFIPNLVNIFPQDDANPNFDIYCGVVTNSYDPNDKTGFPLGIGTTHHILPNQDIEYVVRFQNTGTDTAFSVVILDQLPEELDSSSITPGVSSHDYVFTQNGARNLQFTFNNIMLPDSNINEPASHGFVTFKVKQNPNLPPSTLIENDAAIYFDFNAPIITNSYQHIINDYQSQLMTNVINVHQESIHNLKIFPNPTSGIIFIQQEKDSPWSLSVNDHLGRALLNTALLDTMNQIDLSKFPDGIYYLLLRNGQESIVKKIILY